MIKRDDQKILDLGDLRIFGWEGNEETSIRSLDDFNKLENTIRRKISLL